MNKENLAGIIDLPICRQASGVSQLNRLENEIEAEEDWQMFTQMNFRKKPYSGIFAPLFLMKVMFGTYISFASKSLVGEMTHFIFLNQMA